MSTTEHKAWIGVDLDGTLAHYDGWKGVENIGEPIRPMLERVKKWLEAGEDVRIFTARVFPLNTFERGGTPIITIEESEKHADAYKAGVKIYDWCERYVGRILPITCRKDYAMKELWDDRAVTVMHNRGVAGDALLAWQLKTVMEAAGLKVVDGESYGPAAERAAKRIRTIISRFEDVKAYVDAATDALQYVKSGANSQEQQDLHRAKTNLTRADALLNI